MDDWRRSGIAIVVALLLVGCDPTPSRTPPTTPSTTGPTAASSGPAASPGSSAPAAQVIDSVTFSEAESLPPPPVSTELLTGTPDGFIAAAASADGRWLLASGPDGTSWVTLDASAVAGRIVGAASSAGRWAILEQRPGQDGYRLWWSTDRRHWFEFEQPLGLDRASDAAVVGGGWGFVLNYGCCNAEPGRGSIIQTSVDGRTWRAVTAALDAPRPLPPVAVLDEVLLAARADDGTGAGFVTSTDGVTWEPVTSVGRAGLRSDEALLAAGSVAEIIGWPWEGQPLRTWRGAIAGTDGGPEVTWTETTPSDGFGPIVPTAAASTAGAFTLLGYVPGTRAPVTWTALGSGPWVRTVLPVATFGQGIPSTIAMSGSTAIALGWDVNDVGGFLRHPWIRSGSDAWASVATKAFGVVGPASTALCPPVVPQEIASYLAVPVALRPVCFGSRPLHVKGYAVDCGGCGGTGGGNPTPAWLNNPLQIWALYLQPKPWSEIATQDRMGVAIDPAHPIAIPPIGAFVELTGHFDDPAASTCRNDDVNQLSGLDPPSLLVATCRKEFVATGVRILAN